MTTSGETILEEIVAVVDEVVAANDPTLAIGPEEDTWMVFSGNVALSFPVFRAIASYVADVKARAEKAERERDEANEARNHQVFLRMAAERALAEAVAERDALKAALERLQTPLNNSVPLPRWAAGIVKRALENGGQG